MWSILNELEITSTPGKCSNILWLSKTHPKIKWNNVICSTFYIPVFPMNLLYLNRHFSWVHRHFLLYCAMVLMLTILLPTTVTTALSLTVAHYWNWKRFSLIFRLNVVIEWIIHLVLLFVRLCDATVAAVVECVVIVRFDGRFCTFCTFWILLQVWFRLWCCVFAGNLKR